MNDRVCAELMAARRIKARVALREVRKPDERFRWLTGFRSGDNLYLVSNMGRVYEIYEYSRRGDKGRFEPIHQQNLSADRRVTIFWRNGRSKSYRIVDLVAKRFLKPGPPGSVLSHVDGDINNCMADNLVWRPRRSHS